MACLVVTLLVVVVEMSGSLTLVLHTMSRGTPSGCLTVPPVGKERLVIGDMTTTGIDCFGKLSLLINIPGGDTHMRLSNVAYVSGVCFNLFSLHTVMPKCRVTMGNEGVHVLGGSVSFVRRDTGQHCFATGVTDLPIAHAVWSPAATTYRHQRS